MTWTVDGRTVGHAVRAHLTGAPAADGAMLHIEVAFQLTEWPWDKRGPLSLALRPAEVAARTKGGELRLGYATPAAPGVLTPASHSTTTSARYGLAMTYHALAALEAARNGGEISLVMTLSCVPLFAGQAIPAVDTIAFVMGRDEWIGALRNAGYCKILVTELRLPDAGPSAAADARARFLTAVAARDGGSYADAMSKCRTALDALKNAGFGGKAPSEVVTFLSANARKLTQEERFSALQVALQLYLSPTAHANAPDSEYTREDAELAIAMTAALLRLVPSRWIEPEKET
jgi:hypothetical protein